MNKKGFTLIELMGIIILMSVLILLASPTVIEVVKKSREKLRYQNINTIVEAARQWVASNYNKVEVPDSAGESYCMNLSTLKKTEFFEDVDVIDPTDTSVKFDGSIIITYNANTKQNDFEYVNTKCTREGAVTNYADSSGANSPIVTDNMIPVKYVSGKTIVANRENEWYNYDKSNWANVVVVKANKYASYVKAYDTEIASSDILGYFVWIPRFKYQIWDNDGSSKTPQTINVKFESGVNMTGSGSTNGEWITHPAFCFGTVINDSRKKCSGEEVTGLWIGKFETSGSVTDPKVISNASALVSQNLSNQIKTAKAFTTKYSLIKESDSHVMKNTEWGAVAYLSHSKYGNYNTSSSKNVEVTVNNGSTTGGGTFTSNTNQSTTNNAYGVYDMAGGKKERVASNVLTTSKNFNAASSGITQLDSKYYDKYANITVNTTHTNGHLGDATKEITLVGSNTGWYDDKTLSAVSSTPFYIRGGLSSDSNSAGIFAFESDNGASNSSVGFRIVLVGK